MMYTLYVKPGCPFCERVLAYGQEAGIAFNLKSSDDDGVVEELMTRGGQRMFPYLVDEETGKEMYESLDIIEYLKAKNA